MLSENSEALSRLLCLWHSTWMQSFVCYRLKSQLGASPVTQFDDFISHDESSASRPIPIPIPTETGIDGVVYLVPSFKRTPDWADFIQSGLGDDVSIKSSSVPGALLLMSIDVDGEAHYFAFTFGSGRFLLRVDSYQRRFGLRVALNVMFDGDTAASTSEASRLRSVDAKRVSSNTVRMRHQATEVANFEAFDVDRNRDFLRGVTGVPREPSLWGQNISGSDSLSLNRELAFHDLPAFCLQLLETHNAQHYVHRFGWVDDVGLVNDTQLVEDLEAEVLARLTSSDISDLGLCIPEVVDWDQIKFFVLPTERRPRVKRSELRLVDYVGVLNLNDSLATLTVKTLRSQRLDVINNDDQKYKSWSIWQCLTAEIQKGERKFILDEGDFYEISTSFLARLDEDLRALVPESSNVNLIDADVRWTEGEYNEHAAASGLLLLDKKTVRVPRATSPIEICDLMSPSGQFIHVKRKLGSSLLSHLFAQGHVSADLLQTSSDFRVVAKAMVQSALAIPGSAALNPGAVDVFENEGRVQGVEVVYAIVADWQTDSFVDRLPFFSKINLRQHASDLRSRGFSVSHARIQTRH